MEAQGVSLRRLFRSAFDDVSDDANGVRPFSLDGHVIEKQRTLAEAEANGRPHACSALELDDRFLAERPQ